MKQFKHILRLALLISALLPLPAQQTPPAADPVPPAEPAQAAEPAKSAEPDAPADSVMPTVSKNGTSEGTTTTRIDVGDSSVQVTTSEQLQWHHRHSQDKVAIGGNAELKKGEQAQDAVVIGGKLRVEGEVLGDAVVVMGEAFIDGVINGDLVIVAGSATISSNAVVKGDCVFVGGTVTRAPGAKLEGEIHEIGLLTDLPFLTGLKDFFVKGVLMARPIPPSVGWVWVVVGGMLAFLLALALLFPKPVAAGALAIDERPVVSLLSGLLGLILIFPIALLLIVTVVGIFALPILAAAFIGCVLFGKAAVFFFIGRQLGRQTGLRILEQPLPGILAGALIIIGLYMIPILGFIVWGVGSILAFGAALVAAVGTLNTGPANPAPAIPVFNGPQPAPGMPAGEGMLHQVNLGAEQPPAGNPPQFTPPSSTLLLKRVGFWKRLIASLLDVLLIGVALGWLVNGFLPFFLLAYLIAMWTWKGTTIGMIVLGLKIVRTDGQPINFSIALVRGLSSCFSAMVLFLGFFWAGWDREKQSWHDKIAGTVVVEVPKGVSLL